MNPITRNFIFTSDGITHDATVDETSEKLDSCQNYKWSVTPNPQSLTGGTPEYTIEVSNDNITWFDYDSASSGLDVNNAVDDTHLAFIYMRIKHEAKGSTGGTVEYLFTQKRG